MAGPVGDEYGEKASLLLGKGGINEGSFGRLVRSLAGQGWAARGLHGREEVGSAKLPYLFACNLAALASSVMQCLLSSQGGCSTGLVCTLPELIRSSCAWRQVRDDCMLAL